ncbi:hypothetical protein Csa_008818 [Cucumis sativus]|nr:hypothetical protein Csa_008818 [Cucumis sativus]
MGLSNFPPSAEGVLLLPVLVMNTVMSMAFLKNFVRSVIQMMSASGNSSSSEEEYDWENRRERRISITQFKTLGQSFNGETEEEFVSSKGKKAQQPQIQWQCKGFFSKICCGSYNSKFAHPMNIKLLEPNQPKESRYLHITSTHGISSTVQAVTTSKRINISLSGGKRSPRLPVYRSTTIGMEGPRGVRQATLQLTFTGR